MLDLMIRGGLVVSPEEVGEMDIGIKDGKVVATAGPGVLPGEAGRVIDAHGKIVIPGGIEPHAHIGIPIPEKWAGVPDAITSPPEKASRAAAFGGVTTIVDFAGNFDFAPVESPSQKHIMQVVQERRALFRGHCYTDFTFHHILRGDELRAAPDLVQQIPECIQDGLASFKIFTVHDPFRVPYGHLWSVFDQVAKHAGIMAVHAEDDEIVTFMIDKLKREGCDQGHHLHVVHNNLSEDISFRKILRLANHTGVGIYFVHVTAREGVAAIDEARSDGQPIYGEVLHNYLEFTCEDYKKPDGTLIHTYPAIKYKEDRDALMEGLFNGLIGTTATDEWTPSKEVKLWGKTVETVCGGHNGIETRLPVIFTKCVAERQMSLRRYVEIVSTNAAKILGLYPKKGAIAPGSDADLVLIDPELKKTLTLDDLHADSDYSIWEGFTCQGYPIMTILRGKIIVENGKLLGHSSDGEWVPRKVSPEILARPAI